MLNISDAPLKHQTLGGSSSPDSEVGAGDQLLHPLLGATLPSYRKAVYSFFSALSARTWITMCVCVCVGRGGEDLDPLRTSLLAAHTPTRACARVCTDARGACLHLFMWQHTLTAACVVVAQALLLAVAVAVAAARLTFGFVLLWQLAIRSINYPWAFLAGS